MKSIHSQRLERWLGAERVEHISRCGRGWYGRPIKLIDCPGNVSVCGDGDFIGTFERGYYMSALDSLKIFIDRLGQVEHGVAAAGFTSIGNALARASGGYSQRRYFNKAGSTGVVGVSNSLWRNSSTPAGGAAGSAAPGGRACDNTTTGALAFADPVDGTNRLVGAEVNCGVVNNSLILYDRIFDVAKTMNSSATEAVTGVPTRYQSATDTNEEFAGDNFLFVEVGGTALAATAHNWTVCTYTDQAGNTGATLPSLTGVSGAIVDRYDHTLAQWFAPLATGDTGIKALTQMQCSALVATGLINFVIGHPIGFMSMPIVNTQFPFDWLTNRDQAPLVVNGACLAFIEPQKPASTATVYNGRIILTAAP